MYLKVPFQRDGPFENLQPVKKRKPQGEMYVCINTKELKFGMGQLVIFLVLLALA